MFVPGWRWTASTIARWSPLNQAAILSFSTLSMTRAEIVEPHRRAVAVRDDQRAVLRRRRLSWPVAWMVKALVLAVERAGRAG